MRRPEAELEAPDAYLARLLGDVRSELHLPLPARTRILREVADDAEALYQELVQRGWQEADAAERVRELLLPDDSAKDALRRLHAPLYQRIAERFSPAAMRRWERIAIGVMVSAAVIGGAAAFRTVPLFDDPSPFLIPVLAMGGLGILTALAKAFQLFIKGVHEPEALRRGMASLLATSALTLLAAVGGAFADLYRLATGMEAAHDPTGRVVLDFIRADGALLAAGLMLALVVALAWFLLLQWVAGIEAAERATLSPGGIR